MPKNTEIIEKGIRLSAPAKINLSLRISGLREDGFHEIDSLIAPISLFDEVAIAMAEGQTQLDFSCDDPTLPVGSDNLVVRAAELFFARTGHPAAAAIQLTKRIPHGAGLGGGSSDAAATLLVLNDLHDAPLPREDLFHLAGELGSDVPFFIAQTAARCTGRGEKVSPVDVPRMNLLLMKPGFPVPTPWAYRQWRNSSEHAEVSYQPQRVGDLELVNDLERPVFEKYLVLPVMKQWLREQPGVSAALLSGSGSTMFAVLKDAREGPVLAAAARERFGGDLWTAVCQTCQTAP